MASRKLWLIGLVIFAVTTGCQPPKKKSTAIGRGRGRFSSGNLSAPGTTTSMGTDAGKLWGEVTSSNGDQAFDQELYYFTMPSLMNLGPDDQLGYVSAQSNQNTGVRFYGNAVTSGGSSAQRPFNRATMKIHIEVYDDRTGQQRADGSVRPPVVVEISPANTDTFVDAGGSLNNNQATLYWRDTYGSVYMQGQINGQYFQGSMSYSDSSGQQRTLGDFVVPTCGFFDCQ